MFLYKGTVETRTAGEWKMNKQILAQQIKFVEVGAECGCPLTQKQADWLADAKQRLATESVFTEDFWKEHQRKYYDHKNF
jgi:aminoglycoside phosphotransferase